MSRAGQDVLLEREKQRQRWGDRHDDHHTHGELADAAAVLAVSTTADAERQRHHRGPAWAFSLRAKYQSERRRQLVIAAALVLAEIERLDRDEERPPPPETL